jgi:AcrR family transcriptional regulator
LAKPVKTRTYESPIRREQAESTRARILDAARELFETEGYGAATMAAIAKQAGVAADTVYKTFGAKSRVLTALIDRELAPAGETNVRERPEALAIRDETDQRRQIHLFAADMAQLQARVGPVFEIMRTASGSEPAMAEVLAEMNRHRLENMRGVVDWIRVRGPLRMDAGKAAETVWAMTSPDVARLLFDGRGWSAKRYAAWLEDVLVRTLLTDDRSSKQRPSNR